MNIKRALIAGIAVWIVSFVFGWLTCGWLFNWVYELPPNIWKGPEAMAGLNMVWMNLVGLFVAIVFALVYALLYKGIPGEGIRKGLMYGFIVWLVGALSGILPLPFFMTIATGVVIYWIAIDLVRYLLLGVVVAVIYKEVKVG